MVVIQRVFCWLLSKDTMFGIVPSKYSYVVVYRTHCCGSAAQQKPFSPLVFGPTPNANLGDALLSRVPFLRNDVTCEIVSHNITSLAPPLQDVKIWKWIGRWTATDREQHCFKIMLSIHYRGIHNNKIADSPRGGARDFSCIPTSLLLTCDESEFNHPSWCIHGWSDCRARHLYTITLNPMERDFRKWFREIIIFWRNHIVCSQIYWWKCLPYNFVEGSVAAKARYWHQFQSFM